MASHGAGGRNAPYLQGMWIVTNGEEQGSVSLPLRHTKRAPTTGPFVMVRGTGYSERCSTGRLGSDRRL